VTVGTQAAVLAGLDITMFIEFNPPHNNEWVSPNDPLLATSYDADDACDVDVDAKHSHHPCCIGG
jgi:hypothetical protein